MCSCEEKIKVSRQLFKTDKNKALKSELIIHIGSTHMANIPELFNIIIILRQKQNGRNFTHGILKFIFFKFIEILMKDVCMGPFNN